MFLPKIKCQGKEEKFTYLQFVLQTCIKETFLHFPIPISVEMKAEIRCVYSLITSWASTFLVTHPSVPKFSYHSWLASTTLCWRKYCFPENGYLNLMVTVLYPRGIITIAVRFLQLISSLSALDDEVALLHGNIDLWSLVSEREETHKPSDFSYTSSESAQAANPTRQELFIQLVLCFSAWQPEHCPVLRWPLLGACSSLVMCWLIISDVWDSQPTGRDRTFQVPSSFKQLSYRGRAIYFLPLYKRTCFKTFPLFGSTTPRHLILCSNNKK